MFMKMNLKIFYAYADTFVYGWGHGHRFFSRTVYTAEEVEEEEEEEVEEEEGEEEEEEGRRLAPSADERRKSFMRC